MGAREQAEATAMAARDADPLVRRAADILADELAQRGGVRVGRGLLGLERNWAGPTRDRTSISRTLATWRRP